MSVVQSLCGLALRQVVKAAAQTVGVDADPALDKLTAHFTDHSRRLERALQNANERAWFALELALAGDSFWDRVKSACASAEDKSFRDRVRAFLDAFPPSQPPAESYQVCLAQLRAARKAGLLSGERLDVGKLTEHVRFLAQFDLRVQLEKDAETVRDLAAELVRDGYANLGRMIALKPAQGDPLLVAAVRYFFRREVEGDPELFRGLMWTKIEGLSQSQENGFASLGNALAEHAGRLTGLLQDVREIVSDTHANVLDIREELRRQRGKYDDLYREVARIGDGLARLHERAARAGDSLSIRGDDERRLVATLIARFRALPPGERRNMPALLNALGKLQLAAGDAASAGAAFREVASAVAGDSARAEAHFNAYQAALGQRDFETAFGEFLKAVKLAGRRFAPFPVGKYGPKRILGAGGFGVAFLCRHKDLDADVVVKTLSEGPAQNAEAALQEARLLNRLQHDSVVAVDDCGYTIPTEKARPYFVMKYFDGGVTLHEYVREQPLALEDFLAVAVKMAEGLRAAHEQKVLHRDVKPANVLVRKEDGGWAVKLIDFGLAVRSDPQHNTKKDSGTASRPGGADEIAGTLDFAAPEQMGRLPGVPVGRYSDVYGWAKTCCYALFRTPHPLPQDWKKLPDALATLLGACLAHDPAARPQDFGVIISRLDGIRPDANQWAVWGNAFGATWAALTGTGSGGADDETPPAVYHADPPESGSRGGVEAVRATLQFTAHQGAVRSVSFASDGLRLLSAGADGSVRLSSPRGGELARLAPAKGWFTPTPVLYAAFTPDGQRAFSVAEDGRVRLWNLNTKGEVRSFQGPRRASSAALSTGGRSLLVGGPREVTLWDLVQDGTKREIGGRVNRPRSDVLCVAFMPQGNFLAGDLDGVVHLFDGRSGASLLRLEGHQGGAYAVAAHPKGRHAFVGAGGHYFYLWDLERGKGLALSGHTGEVLAAAVSHDGRQVLSGGADQAVLLWRLPGRWPVRSLKGPIDQVRCVAFSPDGRLAAAGADDGTIHVWRV